MTNYGVNQGDWFVWGGFNGPQNRNAFGMNRSRRIAEFTDGTSQTLMAAEVKTYQAASNCRFTALPSVNNPNNIPSPYANPFTVAPEYDNGTLHDREPVRVSHRVVRRQRARGRVHDGLAAQQGDHRRPGRCTWAWTST